MDEMEDTDDIILLYHGGRVKNKTIKKVMFETGIKKIDDGAFLDCSQLTHVTIPDSVTSIGWSAFGECESLEMVVLPEGVTMIGERAFENCVSLESINLPESLVEIGDHSFGSCKSLRKVVIPKGLKKIGILAFAGSGIQKVVFSKGITSIGVEAEFRSEWFDYGSLTNSQLLILTGAAFVDCESLDTIELPASVTQIDFRQFLQCPNLKNLILPANGLPELKRVCFAGNPFGEHGFRIVYSLIQSSENLTHLSMHHFQTSGSQKLNDDNIRAILSMVEWSSLWSLNISYNDFTPAAFEIIALEDVPDNLRQLSIDGMGHSLKHPATHLVDVLEKNPTLAILTDCFWPEEENDKMNHLLDMNQYGCLGFIVTDPVWPVLIEKLTRVDEEDSLVTSAPNILYHLLRRHSGLFVWLSQKKKYPVSSNPNAANQDAATEKVLGMALPGIETALAELRDQATQMQEQMLEQVRQMREQIREQGRQMEEQARQSREETKQLRLLLEEQQKRGGKEGSQAKRIRHE